MTDMSSPQGLTAVDPDGDKIGSIESVYLDDETGEPAWLAVKTGFFGTKVSFVPVDGSRRQGEDMVVAFAKDQVKGAPQADPDGHLEPDEEARLYDYYGLSYDDGAAVATETTSAPVATADNAMTRSEEELRVGTRQREAGKARLRKWVETEHVATTVPVAHEEVRIEREPITDANADRALQGQEISEGVHKVTLMEEEAVAATETVPKERIRMEKETIVEQEQVGAELRKERVETEFDPPAGR